MFNDAPMGWSVREEADDLGAGQVNRHGAGGAHRSKALAPGISWMKIARLSLVSPVISHHASASP